jgi:acyl carrier protein
MSAPTMDQVRELVADVLGTSASRVTAESSPDTMDNWDSVHHLNIVMAIEERFGVELEPEDIEGMRTVGKIATIVAARANRA